MKTYKQRKLTARYFESSKTSRIYENGKWIYATDSDLSDCTGSDILDFLKRGHYWRK